jgi:D-tyrosyl-tRNA(Tyr) deacylase
VRIVLQRVASASVSIDGAVVGDIGRGILLLVGFGRDDDGTGLDAIATRVLNLRIFPDEHDKLQYSIVDIGGGVLAVPQFTLYARTDRGRRPDFTSAMAPTEAERYFDAFVDALTQARGAKVETGRFGAAMSVSLVNDGPLTLTLEWS